MQSKFYSSVVLSTLMLCASVVFAQSSLKPVNELVNKRIAIEKQASQKPDLFKLKPDLALKSQYQPKELSNASFLSLDNKVSQRLLNSAPAVMELTIPGIDKNFDLVLVKQEPTTSDFSVITDVSDKPMNYQAAAHYRGVVKNQENSLVAISITQGEIFGIIATDEGNYNLGKLSGDDYIFYNDHDLAVKRDNFCGAIEVASGNKVKIGNADRFKSASKCVRVYVETDYELFQSKGSAQAVSDYITALFNQVAVLYQNESITTQLSQVFVWTNNDPYSGSASNYLTTFRSTRTSFNGDIAHLVNLNGNLGGVAYVDVLCNSSYRYAFSCIDPTFKNVPTYSWSVEVFTHEMGHNLGSPHTQSCTWPGGAIDDCYTTEGGCAKGPKPSNGGTIMSYCHLTSTGINFNNGFGPLPGDKVRAEVNGASCLTSCEGGGTPVCNVPAGLSSGSISQTGFTISWNAATGAASYDIQYRKQGTSAFTTTNSTTTSKSISGLTAATTYEFQVRSNCGTNGTSAYSALSTATTASVPVSYCAAKGTNTSAEWIAKVQLGNLNNSTGANGGYADFTAQSANLNTGSTNSLSLSPGFKNGGLLGLFKQTKPETWRVWIDFNRDGDFNDANEMVYSSSSTSTGNISASIVIPSNAATGSTRMRVAMKRTSSASSCETFTYGEVEDYTVNIATAIPAPLVEGITADVKTLNVSLFPNPSTTGKANLSFELSATMGSATVVVYDISGKQVVIKLFEASSTLNSIQHEFDLSQQAPGMYFINVTTSTGFSKTERLVLQ